MNTIGPSINTYLDSMKKDSDPGLQVQTNSSNLQIKQEKNAEMELMTKEGDKITLSFSSTAAAGFSTYDQKGRIGDTTWSESSKSAFLESETNIEIKVEGDLNKEELKDIMKAAKRLEKAMNKLVNGNTEGAIDSLMDAAKGHTIASMESSLTYSKSLEMQKMYESLSQSDYVPGLPDDISQEVPVDSVIPQEQAALPGEQPELSAQTPAVSPTPVENEKSKIENLLGNVKDAINASGIPKLALRPSFENFFDRMISRAEKNVFKDSGVVDFFKKLKEDMMKNLLPENNEVTDTEV